MADVRRSRQIVLLIPSLDMTSVLASDRELPVLHCELGDGESTIEGVARILPSFGLRGPILDCVVDQTPEADLGESQRSALVELGPQPADWAKPPEWAWQPWTELAATAAPGLAEKTLGRIAELSGKAQASEKRAAWTQPGWYESARAWIDESLLAAERALPDAVVQIRHCAISAVLRCNAVDGRTWFKASFPPFHSEASISKTLAELAPGTTCRVISVDASRGWLLLEDLKGQVEATDEHTTKRAIDSLIKLQSSMHLYREELLASGCRHRPLSGLADDFAAALHSEVAVGRLELPRARVDSLRNAVAQSAARIEAVGFPETLVHGDFHPGNVASTSDDIVLFDWSDGAISCPVIEFATWAWWFDGDERRQNELWSWFCSAWTLEFDIDITERQRCDADVVAGAYHLVSYIGLLQGLDPVDRTEYLEGVDHFYAVLTTRMEDPTFTN